MGEYNDLEDSKSFYNPKTDNHHTHCSLPNSFSLLPKYNYFSLALLLLHPPTPIFLTLYREVISPKLEENKSIWRHLSHQTREN